jgi:hypothetical protein
MKTICIELNINRLNDEKSIICISGYIADVI